MYNGIKSIDHPVIAVSNMDESHEVYKKLGFTIPPRGSHVEWGTGNWCIMFENDYLELRGILNPERYTLNLDKVLDKFGEGLMGVAFGTDSAENNHKQMIANGLQPKDLKQLTRNFELDEGWTQPQFSLCFPNDDDVTGLMHVVLCEHLTPELIRSPEYLEHENGVTAVISMTGVISNPDEVESAQKRLLGEEAVKRVDDDIFLTLPNKQVIALLSKENYDKQYGKFSKNKPETNEPYLAAITLKVNEVSKTALALEKNQIPFSINKKGNVIVSAEYTCGVAMEFSESNEFSI